MSTGGPERKGLLEHPLADQFRWVIAQLGGNHAVSEELPSRFSSLEENEGGHLSADIYREADIENDISDSWVRLEFNPDRESLMTTIFVAGLAKRELAKDLLNKVRKVRISEEGAVVFANRDGRTLWLDRENKVTTNPI